jgi:AP-2 complex subunit alpha
MFYVGNKSPGTLTDVALELSGGVDGLHARLAALPTQLEPKKQTQVLLELAAAGGYRAAPGLSLRYSVPGQAPVQVPLKLPYGPHRFMQPWRPANAQEFFAKWQEASAGLAEGKVVTVAPEIARGGLAAIQAALSSVRMTPLPGIDPNQKNLTAGSYAKYGNGGGVETYALARVESDANNPAIFRVTTASTDEATAVGVQEAILSQLLP